MSVLYRSGVNAKKMALIGSIEEFNHKVSDITVYLERNGPTI